jgi:DNA-binding CsgD family transcriptional regulator
MLCQECPSRSVCQSACPELELHLKEIEGSQRELPISNPRHGKVPWPSSIDLTPRENEILTLLALKLSNDEICKRLNITKGNLKFYRFQLKKKYKNL